MKKLLIALSLAATPALAHRPPSNHARHGQHEDAPRSFDKQPPVGTWARCPVSGDVFKVGEDTEFATYEGRVYAFCCDECKPDFIKNPKKYADKKS